MIPDPQDPSLLHRRIYGTVGLTLLVGLYLLVGLTGHDPWRGDDARYFGPVLSMLRGEGLLVPMLAGEPLTDFPPLYYWSAAALARLGSGVLELHDGARLASALFTALAIYFIARAAESLYGRPSRTPAALLTLGTLGLVLHAHETQPLIALLAMVALVLRGLAQVPDRPLTGSLKAGLGAALAFLAGGVPGALLSLPLFPLVMMLSPECRTPRASGALLLGLCLALTAGALWPLAVHLLEPDYFALWLRRGWRALSDGALRVGELPRLLELLGWFTWPLWLLATWALWRGRRQLLSLPWLLPLLSAALTLAWLVLRGDLSQANALPILPAIALLAAGGVPTLRRGAASAFDWFALMTFAVVGILVWLAWTALAYGWPPGLARSVARMAPEFVLRGGDIQLALGVLISVLWLGLVWWLPRSSSRAPANWAMGMTMLWCLAVVLLMPWFDHGRSYRPVAQSLALAVAGETTGGARECIATTELPPPLRSSLDYFAGIRPLRAEGGVTPCHLLLVYEDRRPLRFELAPEWQTVWQYRRGGGRQLEVFRLYRRAAP